MFHSIPKVYMPRLDRLYHRLRPRQQRVELDLAMIQEILAEYEFELTHPPDTLTGGNRSYSLILATSHGKKILKKYKNSLGKSTILQEHSILTYLAQINFSSSRLASTRTGQTLVCRDEQHYALFDFIEGGFQYHNYILLPGQARQFVTIAAEILAILHDALKDFVPQGYNPDGFKSKNEDRTRNLEWLINKFRYCVEQTSRQGNNKAAWLLEQAPYFEKSVTQLEAKLKDAPLPRLIIHADYGPYNLLFRDNGPPIVLDFEMARLDWRVTELIDVWYRFCYDKLGFKINKMKYLLEAYQIHFPLTKDELYYIPDVWKFWNIWRCILNWHNYCETQSDVALAKAQQNLDFVNWMTVHQSNLDFL